MQTIVKYCLVLQSITAYYADQGFIGQLIAKGEGTRAIILDCILLATDHDRRWDNDDEYIATDQYGRHGDDDDEDA